MSPIDSAAAERLYMFGRRLVTAVRTEDPSDYLAALARLDRGELEHLVVLLAAAVPDEVGGGRRLGPPTVAELVAERFHAGRPRRTGVGGG